MPTWPFVLAAFLALMFGAGFCAEAFATTKKRLELAISSEERIKLRYKFRKELSLGSMLIAMVPVLIILAKQV